MGCDIHLRVERRRKVNQKKIKNMTYRQLAESIEIFAKYNGGMDAKCLEMYAEHDEHGIFLKETPSASDLRKLQKYGWLLGCDAMFNKEDSKKWRNADKLSDDEIVELYENYDGLFLIE